MLHLLIILVAAVLMSAACSDGLEKPKAIVGGETEFQVGEVILPSFFSDGVVFQRNSQVKIFGKLKGGEGKIVLKCGWTEQMIEGVTDENGYFSFNIQTPEAGGPYSISINDTQIEDVMIGEVWLASGQSNMAWKLSDSDMEGLSGENNPDIRIFNVPIQLSKAPVNELDGGEWLYGSVEEIKTQTTAVGYYFARKLQNELDIPIGIICSSKGGTGAEEWMSEEAFSSLPADIQETFPATDKRWGACRYNAMINPIKDYIFRGAIWYQGENNVPRNWTYSTVLEALINDWRDVFSNCDFPFYIVQLPSYNKEGWKELRAQQENVSDKLDNCEIITTIDQGEETNIHPVKKIHIGERLGEVALSNTYGKSGFRSVQPRIVSCNAEGSVLNVKCSGVSGLKTSDGGNVKYMEICGENEIYYPADVELYGNEMKVSSPEVKSPVKVRYYWVNFGKPNLVDTDGWPVAPFFKPNENECLDDNLFDKSSTSSINSRYAVSLPFIYDEWISVNTDKENISFSVEEDSERGNVVKMRTEIAISNKYPFRGFLTQRLRGPLSPGVYELSFYIKADDNDSMCRVFINCTDDKGNRVNKWFILHTGGPNAVYCSNNKVIAGSGWRHFTCLFDLSRTIGSPDAKPIDEAETSNETDLKDVLVCLQNGTPKTELLIDEVTFHKYSEK